MLRLLRIGLLVFCAVVWGCSDGGDSTGTGGTKIFEPGPTCIAFCARVIGECGAFTFDEASCRQGCQTNLSEAYGYSEECGTALEAMFQCVAETDDCQDVYDWRDRVSTDHACTAAVDNVGVVCPF